MSILSPDSMKAFVHYMRATHRQGYRPRTETDPVSMVFGTSLASFEDHLRLMEQPYNPAGQAFTVAAGYADTPVPTAFADRQDNWHIVGMHTALAVAVQELALFCFAQAEFFDDIGNAAAEQSPAAQNGQAPGLWLLMRTLDGQVTIDANAPRIVPVDPYRHAGAVYLALLMLRFVWFHELAHGMLGHIDYRRHLSGNGSCWLDECALIETKSGFGSIDSHALQSMEFEADSSALARVLMIQYRGLENIDGIKAFEAGQRIRMVLFSVYAMTWLFEVFHRDLYRRKLSVTHPAPFTRLNMLHSMAARTLNDIGTDTGTIAGDAMRQLATILPRLGESWQSIDGFDPLVHRAAFEIMRKELAPFRYLVTE